MRFHVGPFVYEVEITHDPLYNEAGERCDGICDSHRQRVWIRGDLPVDQQVFVLMHELRHAWAYHWPHTLDEESECDLVGQMVLQLVRDMQPWAQSADLDAAARALVHAMSPLASVRSVVDGGLVSSTVTDGVTDGVTDDVAGDEPRVGPLDTVSPTECARYPTALRVQCQWCEKVYSAGAVVQGLAAWSDEHGSHLVRRSVYCDHCQHVQHWVETCTGRGLATGQIVQEPTFTRGADAERFLREFPQAAGVMDG